VAKRLPLVLARAALPPRQGFDRAQKDKTEPEVHKYTEIQPGGIVTGSRRQVRHQQEVDSIPRHHGDEALQKVHSSLF